MRPNRFAIHNFFAIALSLAATLLVTITAHAQNEWFVDDDALDGGNGEMWETAFNDLQNALDEARDSIGSDLILVAQGEYFPTEPAVPGDPDARAVTFYLFAPELNNVEIQGGYKGCPGGVCENPDDRDIEQYETILSGSIFQPEAGELGSLCDENAGDCHLPNGTPGCNDEECCMAVCDAYSFCCNNQWDALCAQIAIDIGGPCETEAYHVVTADGVNNTVVLSGCTVTEGGVPGSGSGIDSQGGGMLILDASPTVADCTFTANFANTSGGGMMIKGTSPAEIRRCTFTANTAVFLGGGMAIQNASPAVIRCTFTANTANFHGAGAMNIAFDSDPIVVNTSFIGNTGDEAGAIHIENGLAGGTFVNCLFSGNTSLIEGGAINRGGGGTLTLINCTLVNNTVESSVGGGAIFTEDPAGPVILTNCILWKNLAAGMPRQIVDSELVVSVNYSDIEGGFDCQGLPNCGEGNIDADPLFVDPVGPDGIPGTEDDDLHLLAGSPCIDKGNPEQSAENCGDPGLIPCDVFDLDGDGVEMEPTPDLDISDRVVDGDDVPGPIVDMGAYEYCEPEPCPWDLNGSCDVGILDLLALLAAWGPNPGDPADFDGDGIVGILDLLTLLANWGACPGLCPCVPITSEEPPLEEVLTAVGLSMDDWDLLQEILHSGNNEAIDNALCWFGYYINGCDGGTRQACSDHDPFTDCVGDLNGDCCVDKLDSDILLIQMGPCPVGPGACLGDLNGDCVVDKTDHRDLLSHFGACPTTQFCTSVPPGCGTTTTEGLEEAVTLMGFTGVADYQAHISATSEGEAFVCACVLQVLLEAQP